MRYTHRPIRRQKRKKASNDLMPLIDIIFQLLLFFILTYAIGKQSIPLHLPDASTSERLKKTDIVISMDAHSRVFIDNREMTVEELPGALRNVLGALPEKDKAKIVFYGDEKITYQSFVTVMDIIKNSGVRDINIAHQEKK